MVEFDGLLITIALFFSFRLVYILATRMRGDVTSRNFAWHSYLRKPIEELLPSAYIVCYIKWRIMRQIVCPPRLMDGG